MATIVIRGIRFAYNPHPQQGQDRTDWIPRFGIQTSFTSVHYYTVPDRDYSLTLTKNRVDYDSDQKLVGALYVGGVYVSGGSTEVPGSVAARAVFSGGSFGPLALTIAESGGNLILTAPTIQEPSYSRSYENGQPPIGVSFQLGLGSNVPYQTALNNSYTLNLGRPSIQYGDVTLTKRGSPTIRQGFFEEPGGYSSYDESIVFGPSTYSCPYRIETPGTVSKVNYEAYYTADDGSFVITSFSQTVSDPTVTDFNVQANPYTSISQ